MAILTQFVFRMLFGLALAMTVPSPRQVTSGYYRNHSYVLLGLAVLASLVTLSMPTGCPPAIPLAAAALSYAAAVAWLYEQPMLGRAALWAVAAVGLWGALAVSSAPMGIDTPAHALALVDPPTGSLVLGTTLAAMFLGHWYLNSPTMVLAPLARLLWLMSGAIALRAIVAGTGLALTLGSTGGLPTEQLLLVALRWLSGLAGAAVVAELARRTLAIPNTQSATGILYVGVIFTFLGELVSSLLSLGAPYPL